MKQVLLKLSGELLSSSAEALDYTKCRLVVEMLLKLQQNRIAVAVVIGGGNQIRGRRFVREGFERESADQIGMLATLMNGAALRSVAEQVGLSACLMSALEVPAVSERYSPRRGRELLASGSTLLLAGGTGHSYFTTDMAAALRAAELRVDALLKATKVDGLYSEDPFEKSGASFYRELSYDRYLAEKLAVMDCTAIALCQQESIPIYIFNMKELFSAPETLLQRLLTQEVGSYICSSG